MRTTILAASLFLAHAGASHAALGGAPVQFGTAPVVASVTNFTLRETLLPTGTRVREYVSASGTVFAVSWNGPFLPDLRNLLGPHFETMTAEAALNPKAGRSQLVVRRPEVVIFSGGHMRAFEGRAWLPAELPAGFDISDIR